MPIKLNSELPAVEILQKENIFVMTDTRAITQDIRPLKILFLNLNLKKTETERHVKIICETESKLFLYFFQPELNFLALLRLITIYEVFMFYNDFIRRLRRESFLQTK